MDNNQLLQKFLTEGLSSMRALKDQNDAIQRDMTDVKTAMATIREQIVSLSESFRKGQEMLERENKELRQRLTEHEKELISLDKKIITLDSEGGRKAIAKLSIDLDDLDDRVSRTESQQSKWLGALTVIGIVVGFALALLKEVLV
jgi:cell division septum initiation protein DivIVA